MPDDQEAKSPAPQDALHPAELAKEVFRILQGALGVGGIAPSGSPLSTLRVTGLRILPPGARPWRQFKPGEPPADEASPEGKRWKELIRDMEGRLNLCAKPMPRSANVPPGAVVLPKDAVQFAIRRMLRETCPADYERRTAVVLNLFDDVAKGVPGASLQLGLAEICMTVVAIALGEFVAPLGDEHATRWEQWSAEAAGCASPGIALVDFATDIPKVLASRAALIGSFQVVVPFDTSWPDLSLRVAEHALLAVSGGSKPGRPNRQANLSAVPSVEADSTVEPSLADGVPAPTETIEEAPEPEMAPASNGEPK